MKYLLKFTVLFLFNCSLSWSQNSPVAASLENNVDLFTGDFKHSIPLISVSGPNGENFPLQLNYRSDIKTNQEASWVGLGWSLNLGEINRQVNGLPDDWRAASYTKYKILGIPSTPDVEYKAYGPVWFKDYDYNPYPYNGTIKSSLMDIATSRRKEESKPASNLANPSFKFPDYDNFYVSGPGVGGQMRPYLFDYAEFHEVDDGWIHHKRPWVSNLTKFSQDVQFRFVNDPAPAKNTWPYYETSPHYGHLNNGSSPSSNSSWSNNMHSWEGAIPRPGHADVTGHPAYTPEMLKYTNPNQTTKWEKRQKVYAANYIEYFTNQEIQDHYDGTTGLPGTFLDFKNFSPATGTRLKDANGNLITNPLYDPTGIGAFRVTTPNGMTYHYSLPVYVKNESHISCGFKNVNTSPSLEASKYEQYNKDRRYAYTWKLTAITGLDYEDVNGNNFPDENDKGYWIYINYEKWNKNGKSFIQRDPYHGFFIDKTYKSIPTSFFEEETYQLRGTKSVKRKDVYYPNYIKTATQTLFIVKELREDGHGAPRASVQNELPQLKIKELILLRNEDVVANNVFSSYSAIPQGSFSNLSSDANTNSMLHSGDFSTSVQSTINPLILQRIRLDYDYSLCQGVYNNVNNTTGLDNNSYKLWSTTIFSKVTSVAKGANSGKLTLKKIYVYGRGGENVYGVDAQNQDKVAYEFAYPSGALNPDYRHDYQDFFGNYKFPKDLNHFDRIGYTTDSDVALLPAWSLNKMTTPLKGEIDIVYEGDEYAEIYQQNYRMDLPTQPRRFFDFTCEGADCNVLKFNDPDAMEYIQSINLYSVQAGPQITVKIGYDCNGTNHIKSSFIRIGSNGTDLGNNRYQLHSSELFHTRYKCSGTQIDLDNVEGRLIVNLKKVDGGGSRVRSISLTEPDKNEIYKLKLKYGVGVIGTENGRWMNEASLKMKPALQQADRFAPPSVVGYKTVKTRLEAVDYLNSTDFGEVEYQFYYEPDVFVRSAGKGVRSVSTVQGGHFTHFKNFIKVSLFNQGLYGTLKKKMVKSQSGETLQATEYKYTPQIIDYITNEQNSIKNGSRIREVFYKSRVDHSNSSHLVRFDEAFLYEEIGYKLTEVINRGIENGNTSLSQFDDWSGAPGRVKTIPYETNVYTEPAYEQYASMGSKFLSPSNTNQLGSIYGSTNTRFKEQNNYSNWSDSYFIRELGNNGKYEFNTKSTGVWKARSSYTSAKEDQTEWDLMAKVSMYNNALKPIENLDRQGNFSATKYNVTNERVIASASNCNYLSFFASSFEESVTKGNYSYYEDELKYGNKRTTGNGTTLSPHTGKYMVEVVGNSGYSWGPIRRLYTDKQNYDGELIDRGLLTGRTYEASVWVHHTSSNGARLNISLKGNDANGNLITNNLTTSKNDATALQIGDWILLKLQVDIPEGFTTDPNDNTHQLSVYLSNNFANSNGYFDDFRFQPVDAQVESIVYDEKGIRPKFILNNENFYTELEYDAAGNVIRTYAETEQGRKLLTEKEIHYAD